MALMARIPPVERGVGADRLARWHSMGGRYIIGLVVAHALLITWGYAVTAHTTVIHQAWTLLDSYPDVLLATVGGLLLVMTARRVRPRRPAAAALRDVVLPALLHLPGGRARVQPPVRRRRGVHDEHRRAGRLVRPVRGRRGGHRLVPVRHPGPAGAAAPAAGHGGQAGGARRGVRRDRRPPPGGAARGVRPVLPLALPHPRPVVDVVPLLAVRAAAAATGCASPSRRPGTTATPSAGCGPAPASSPRARTARSPGRGGAAARCC